MRIGITERGDASIDYTWMSKVSSMDGTILITKNLTDKFIQTVVNLHSNGTRLIVHATCTGWGSTAFEPNVHEYKWQLAQLKKLIDTGFPASHCVLRIDPIFPTENGLRRVREVLQEFKRLDTDVKRIRISVYDEYRHVKERLKAKGYQPYYGDRFYANSQQMLSVANTLSLGMAAGMQRMPLERPTTNTRNHDTTASTAMTGANRSFKRKRISFSSIRFVL